ncbi:MAG TPA: hypothetical protein VFP10_04595 [Candidatus Eisenbacteria bacterium]|nr:hypothetical protein [Candidatus Eisenbacteria bacterium]
MIARVSRFLFICGALFISAAHGAEWDPLLESVSPAQAKATLGISSRNAAVDAAGDVHLVYQNSSGVDQFQLFYVTRYASGSWSQPIAISPAGVNTRNASVSLDHEGRIHVTCEIASVSGDDIAHIVRDVNGTWSSAPVLLFPSAGSSRSVASAVDSFDKLHVVWVDGRDGIQRILHGAWSAAEGWRGPDVLSVGGTVPQDPTMDADELGGIHVFWSDRVPAQLPDLKWDLFYTRLDAASPTIPLPRDLVRGGATAVRPYVDALADGTLHLVWLDNRSASRYEAFEVFYKRYLPGVGWGKDKRFTYDITNHARPVIVAGGGPSLNVVWEDFRFGSPDIFYRQITPERGWDRDLTQLTTDESASQAPTLVSLTNGGLLLIWSDAQESGTFRIFAKEGAASP